jgi:hypothetical protein
MNSKKENIEKLFYKREMDLAAKKNWSTESRKSSLWCTAQSFIMTKVHSKDFAKMDTF